MTSNQISAELARIESRNVDNQDAHNKRIDEENYRHNTKVEDLEATKLDLVDKQNKETERHNSVTEQLTAQYNQWYEQFTEANEAEKRDIERQMAAIEEYKAQEDAEYKAALESYNERIAAVSELQAQEVERHNTEMEALQSERNSIDDYKNTLESRKLVNEGYYYQAVMANMETQNSLRLMEINNQATRNMIEGNRVIFDTTLKQEQLKIESKKANSEVIRNITSGLSQFVNTAAALPVMLF